MYLPNPSLEAGCDTESFFLKQTKAGFNSEFSFSYTGCFTKTKRTQFA